MSVMARGTYENVPPASELDNYSHWRGHDSCVTGQRERRLALAQAWA